MKTLIACVLMLFAAGCDPSPPAKAPECEYDCSAGYCKSMTPGCDSYGTAWNYAPMVVPEHAGEGITADYDYNIPDPELECVVILERATECLRMSTYTREGYAP